MITNFRKVISEVLYDTSTAEELADVFNERPEPDENVEEILYRKKNGEFFLYGSGGGYNVENITPLSIEEAYDWAKEQLEEDAYKGFLEKIDKVSKNQLKQNQETKNVTILAESCNSRKEHIMDNFKGIVNGLLYDTEKADFIGEFYDTNRRAYGYHVGASLYRKKNGEFFLHGSGSAEVLEQIIPLSFEEARQWTEDKLDAETYIRTFGNPGEDGEYLTIGVMLSREEYEKLEELAEKHDWTLSEGLANLIDSSYMEGRKNVQE